MRLHPGRPIDFLMDQRGSRGSGVHHDLDSAQLPSAGSLRSSRPTSGMSRSTSSLASPKSGRSSPKSLHATMGCVQTGSRSPDAIFAEQMRVATLASKVEADHLRNSRGWSARRLHSAQDASGSRSPKFHQGRSKAFQDASGSQSPKTTATTFPCLQRASSAAELKDRSSPNSPSSPSASPSSPNLGKAGMLLKAMQSTEAPAAIALSDRLRRRSLVDESPNGAGDDGPVSPGGGSRLPSARSEPRLGMKHSGPPLGALSRLNVEGDNLLPIADSGPGRSSTALEDDAALRSKGLFRRPGLGADHEEPQSGLLARRRLQRPGGRDLQKLITKRQTRDNGLKVTTEGEIRRIRPLPEGKKIFDLYYWDEVIQETGCGGKVVVCSPKSEECTTSPRSPFSGSKSKVARGSHVMKIKSKVELRKNGEEEIFRKANLKMLNLPPHVGILPLYEVLEDDAHFFVVMEKANGGSLLSSLLEECPDGVMPELVVMRLMKEILSAIAHLHQQGILHKDIKADNLVVEVNDEPTSPGGKIRTVKLIDFDLSDPDWVPDSPGTHGHNWAGTKQNSAPETFRGTFSQQSDLYSAGTILYLLMTGRWPHNEDLFGDMEFDEDVRAISQRMAMVNIDWNDSCWSHHPSCQDFCKWLLDFDPAQRPASAVVAARHEWFG